MHRADGGGGQGFQHEIAVRDAVERVGGGPVEAQRRRRGLPVDGERGAGQRGGAERAFVQPRAGVAEAAAVARQHFHMRQQVVAESDGLRRLQMREAGHRRVRMRRRLARQRQHERRELPIQRVDGVAHPQPEIRRHLVIARARGVQPPAGGADHRGETSLDIQMNILERARKREGSGLDFRADRV